MFIRGYCLLAIRVSSLEFPWNKVYRASMQFLLPSITVLILVTSNAFSECQLPEDMRLPHKPELFLSPLEAGFMSPGYYVSQGRTAPENYELNVKYQKASSPEASA